MAHYYISTSDLIWWGPVWAELGLGNSGSLFACGLRVLFLLKGAASG